MIVSIKELREIILEEYLNLLSEVSLCHSPKTGHFTKCNKDSVYSLTKKGASNNNIDPSFVGRGLVSTKEDDKPPRLKSKFGQNQIGGKKVAGRKDMTGKDISPQYSVSKYPERYSEELETLKSYPDVRFGMREIEDAMKYLEEDKMDDFCKKCSPCQGRWQASFLRALNMTNLASQGKLNDKK